MFITKSDIRPGFIHFFVTRNEIVFISMVSNLKIVSSIYCSDESKRREETWKMNIKIY